MEPPTPIRLTFVASQNEFGGTYPKPICADTGAVIEGVTDVSITADFGGLTYMTMRVLVAAPFVEITSKDSAGRQFQSDSKE